MADSSLAAVSYSSRAPCYYCGERRPVTKDHVPGRWLYRRLTSPPAKWPTAPLCSRCKSSTDVADNELHRFVLEAAGSGTRQWPIYVDALRREDELRRDLSKRIFAARDGAGEVRMGSERSKFLIGHALNKLARGLQWVRNGNRIADDALSLWEPRIGLSPFEFDRKLVVTEFQFGPDFLCSIGADRFGQRWHVSFLGRVHFAIAYLDMTSWWRHATRWLAHTRR